MKFTFEIPDDDFFILDSDDFKKEIREAAVDKICGQLINIETNVDNYGYIYKKIDELMKSHAQEIIDSVKSEIIKKIERKRDLLEVTPTLSQLKKMNKENQKYFEELIDKAIAKKFK